MNLESGEGGYRLRLDLDAIAALLEDYFSLDLWPVLEAPPGEGDLDVVIGGRSGVFSPADRARVEGLAAANPRLQVHLLANAGHWVHVDDPEGLFALLSAAL
jgi:pimeloyl-ACP methyl ester carboxylesterase